MASTLNIDTLTIDPAGSVRFIYSDSLADLAHALGGMRIQRASHVEPVSHGEHSGQWCADLSPVNGPTLGPFPRRDQALAAEVAWLDSHPLEVATALA